MQLSLELQSSLDLGRICLQDNFCNQLEVLFQQHHYKFQRGKEQVQLYQLVNNIQLGMHFELQSKNLLFNSILKYNLLQLRLIL